MVAFNIQQRGQLGKEGRIIFRAERYVYNVSKGAKEDNDILVNHLPEMPEK